MCYKLLHLDFVIVYSVFFFFVVFLFVCFCKQDLYVPNRQKLCAISLIPETCSVPGMNYATTMASALADVSMKGKYN